MRWGSARRAAPAELWLVDVCTAELRAHQFLFWLILCPLLAVWLPFIMFDLSISVLLQLTSYVTGTSAGDGSQSSAVWRGVAAGCAVAGALFGIWREHRRHRIADGNPAVSALRVSDGDRGCLEEQLRTVWGHLTGRVANLPRLICQPTFGLSAHAYDNRTGQAVELSAGLASRVIAGDPLAMSILRHEVAHLAFRDLPWMRRQAIAASAMWWSALAALGACSLAALGAAATADLFQFPEQPTLSNVVSLHVALVLLTLIVAVPVLLACFIARRYAGFIVALMELRADVSAGIWGAGLREFSSRLSSDPSVRPATVREFGRAYLSPSLIHLPAQERASLLSHPQRLATPKLRYCAAALAVIWLVPFHQGAEVWDVLMLSAAVALLQAVAVSMVLRSRGRLPLSAGRAATLAAGLLVAQALPLISIEGMAYLAEHLTAAVVSRGGFGTANDTNYIADVSDTIVEFGRNVAKGVGGPGFCVSIAVSGGCFWLMSRMRPASPMRERRRVAVIAALSFVMSFAVSHHFFQEALEGFARHAAWASSADEPDGWWALCPSGARRLISWILWSIADHMHDSSTAKPHQWLQLSLPHVAGLAAALAALGRLRDRAPDIRMQERNSNGAFGSCAEDL